MKRYKSLLNTVEATQWPSVWSRQSEIAKYLGMSGIPLQFENGATEPSDKQYVPQLYLFTYRYDRVCVRVGDWIVLKGDRRFAVLPKDEFYNEYQEV